MRKDLGEARSKLELLFRGTPAAGDTRQRAKSANGAVLIQPLELRENEHGERLCDGISLSGVLP
jgi:hypothetical protein